MPRVLNLNSYSFNSKIAILLFLLAIFLITILLSLIVPKMQEDEYKATLKEIDQVLTITQEQIKVASKSINNQSILENKVYRNYLALQVEYLDNNLTFEELKNKLKDSKIAKFTSYAIKSKNKLFVNNDKKLYLQYKRKQYNKWEEYKTKIDSRYYGYKVYYFFYTKKLNKDLEITIFCNKGNLNPNHHSFEKKIKINVQNTFKITQDLHKGKSYLFWLNSKYKEEEDIALYIKDKKKSEQKYTLSNMSNVNNIYTGNLSAKEIMQAKDKAPISHTLNNKEAISWIRDLSYSKDSDYIFLLVKTVYKKDLIKNIDSALLKILPAALISLLLALSIGFFLFKSLFKRINILTNTAKEVRSGNKKTRSNIKGKDDVGLLGIVFDSMLDSIENNIKTLDSKIKEKTNNLQNSLDEKEILLKEIHHRVKNNLSLTIGLIKLQQEEIKEEKTKQTLNDIQERIYTMELVHRKLYESKNLNQIDFKKYVENLIENISYSYDYKNNLEKIIEIEDIYLNIEQSMSCGLILNEIITNAFKYAFKDNIKPILFIKLEKNKKSFTLIIKDNGKGISKNINIHNSNTLGLKLISSISKHQLRAEIDYTYKNGAVFTIIFQEKDKSLI